MTLVYIFSYFDVLKTKFVFYKINSKDTKFVFENFNYI